MLIKLVFLLLIADFVLQYALQFVKQLLKYMTEGVLFNISPWYVPFSIIIGDLSTIDNSVHITLAAQCIMM